MDAITAKSTFNYKLFCYLQELHRPKKIAKRLIETKIDLTVGLIGECCNNTDPMTLEDLDTFVREAKLRKLLLQQKQSLWPKGQLNERECADKKWEQGKRARINKVALDRLARSMKKMDLL